MFSHNQLASRWRLQHFQKSELLQTTALQSCLILLRCCTHVHVLYNTTFTVSLWFCAIHQTHDSAKDEHTVRKIVLRLHDEMLMSRTTDNWYSAKLNVVCTDAMTTHKQVRPYQMWCFVLQMHVREPLTNSILAAWKTLLDSCTPDLGLTWGCTAMQTWLSFSDQN